MQNCLACQDKFFVNNHLDVERNHEHTLDFVPRLSCLSGPAEFPLSSPNAYLIIDGVSFALGLKHQLVRPAACNCIHRLPRNASTVSTVASR
jgi:hypothetical protein